MPDSIGAPSSEASGSSTAWTGEDVGAAATGILGGVASIIQGATGGTPAPVGVTQPPAATFGHTVDWKENWPILAAVGALAVALLIRK